MNPRTRALVRVSGRLLGPKLSLALLPGWAVLAFGFTQLRDILDWPALMAWASGQSMLDAASSAAVATSLWGAAFAQPLRRSLYSAELGVLWRQSARPVDWSVALGPWLVVAGLPLLAVGWLWQSPVALVGAGVGWCWVAVGAARGGAIGVGTALAGAGLAGVLFALGRLHPAALLLVGLAAAGSLPHLGRVYLEGRARPVRARRALPGRPASPVEALLRRDLLCLLRTAPGVLVAAVLPALPVYLVLSALRSERIFVGEAAVAAAVVVLCFCAPVTGWAMTTLRERLGRQFDAPCLPVDGFTRAIGLTLVGELLMLPTAAFAVLALAPEGWSACLRVLLCSSALTAAAVWAAARTLGFRDDGAPAGWSLLTSFVVGVIAVSGPLSGPLGCIGVIALALSEAGSTFEHQRAAQ